MVKDPVCGMDIEPQDAVASREHMGQTFYFCSPNCVAQFDADPHRYAQAALAATEAPLPVGSATTGFNPALPLARIDLPVLGLKREQDGRAVEAAVAGVPGVRSAHANTGSGVVTVEYDPQRATTAALAAALRPAGFRAGGAQTRIGIEGLRCASCVGFIEDDLRATPGVLSASVNVGTQEATIAYLPQQTTLAQLHSVIQDWGYQARPAASEEPVDKQEAEHDREYRSLFRKFLFAALISVPVLITAYPQFIPFVRDWSMATLRLAWLGCGAADPAGAFLVGRPLLHRRVGGAQAPRGQHEHPDRARHRRGLALLDRRHLVSTPLPGGHSRSRSTTWWRW